MYEDFISLADLTRGEIEELLSLGIDGDVTTCDNVR